MNQSPTRITSLPPDLLRKILLDLGNESISNVCAARMAHRCFNNAANHDGFYHNLDLVFMKIPRVSQPQLHVLCERCYESGNPSALYLKGMYDYFCVRNVEAGMYQLEAAAASGFLVARYVMNLMKLILSVNDLGVFHYECTISRDEVAEVRKRLGALTRERCGWRLPWFYRYKSSLLHTHKLWACVCAKYDRCKIWHYRNNEPRNNNICDECFWELEAARFCKLIPPYVSKWPL